MSPLRKEALQLLETVPEEKLVALIQFMQTQSERLSRKEKKSARARRF